MNKKCNTCKYREIDSKKHEMCKSCICGDRYEQEPTTKNDLGVENDLIGSIIEKISEKVTETREEFIFETIRPYCENVVQMKISKRDLEQALLKYYGKNDLGVDAISRFSAEQLVRKEFCNIPSKTYNKLMVEFDELPSVTPKIEPKKGHWILRDVEGVGRVWFCNCSECGKDPQDYISGTEDWWLTKTNLPKFCPNCGSDNRGAESED